MKPTVGRIVHYVSREGEHVAAMIVGVNSDGSVSLTTFPLPAGSTGLARNVVYSNPAITHPLTQTQTWHWPERE